MSALKSYKIDKKQYKVKYAAINQFIVESDK